MQKSMLLLSKIKLNKDNNSHADPSLLYTIETNRQQFKEEKDGSSQQCKFLKIEVLKRKKEISVLSCAKNISYNFVEYYSIVL